MPAARTRAGSYRSHAVGEVAERRAGDGRHLEGAHGPAHVARLDLRGGHRVGRVQAPVERAGAQRRRPRASSSARTAGSSPGNSRSSTTARKYSPDPPTSSGRRALARTIVGRPPGGLLEASDRERLAGLGEVEQVVRHRRRCSSRGLRGADVHAPVDEHRVHRARSRRRAHRASAMPASVLPLRRRAHERQRAAAAHAGPSDGRGGGFAHDARRRGGARRRGDARRRRTCPARARRAGARCGSSASSTASSGRSRPRPRRAPRRSRPTCAAAFSPRSVPAAPRAGRTAPARPPSAPDRRSVAARVPGRGEYWNV